MRDVQLSFDDHRRRTGRGGPRSGAGRPRGRRSVVYHVRRETLPKECPVHVTLRVRAGIASLRSRTFVRALKDSLREAHARERARLVHFSVQRDHLHLILEADGKRALGSAMKCIAARVARCVHRVFRRAGPVLLGRYHVRALRTPREVRSAIAYVLLNARKHWQQRTGAPPPVRIDDASSGAWFDGWSRRLQPLSEPSCIAPPRTWLLRTGWQRHGLIDPSEVPASSPRGSRR